jgi:hypothetical protein
MSDNTPQFVMSHRRFGGGGMKGVDSRRYRAGS